MVQTGQTSLFVRISFKFCANLQVGPIPKQVSTPGKACPAHKAVASLFRMQQPALWLAYVSRCYSGDKHSMVLGSRHCWMHTANVTAHRTHIWERSCIAGVRRIRFIASSCVHAAWACYLPIICSLQAVTIILKTIE